MRQSNSWSGNALGSACVSGLFRARRPWFVAVALLCLDTAFAQQSDTDRYVLENARVIVGDGSVFEQAAITVEEGRIVSVQPGTVGALDEQIERIDLSGKTVMPALIDSHAHLGYEGHGSFGSENYTRENLIDHLKRYAYYGFSAVFSAGSDPDVLAQEVQRAEQRGEFSGARFLFAAGMAPPGQGPNDQFLAHALALEEQTGQDILYGVADPEQAVDAVRAIAGKGIGVIKIWVDDRGGSQLKLTPALYRAIAEEARAQEIEVYAHQQFALDMPPLIDAGITGFLHGRLGPDLDSNIAGQLAQAGAFVVPNLGLGELRREAIGLDPFLQQTLPADVLSELGEGERRLRSPLRDDSAERELRESFARLLAAEVEILLGTDAGAVPEHYFGYTGHRELEIFVRLGMSPMQALVAATSKPAARLGLDDLGLLRSGYSADLIVLDDNPLEDIRNTRSIHAVYLRGYLIDRESMASEFSR